ncbi:cytochrome c oxidase subunit 3 [Ketobacter sp.]|uniref:cytochrome c oxidase subunit 3 n=1 Tax=Ketobacter sp. TaxID=2083498 RepID=UPI000F1EA3F2|nr:cytochrome c oxidase subunit 3 [Ketobacter sp.]RLT95629.1 MAG: cytochrome c oxidase subunit 3 family protein [Ketobacter sp.]
MSNSSFTYEQASQFTEHLQGPSGSAPDKPIARVPGQAAMWFFVVGDLWIFTCYFACYAYDRAQEPMAFLQGQLSLSQDLGAFNTVLLLTSSLLVALCLKATRKQQHTQARQLLLMGGTLGVCFLLIKAAEWYVKIEAGLPVMSGQFFIYYFMFTGLHFMHVSLGLVILTLVYLELKKATAGNLAMVEAGAVYWHMVDLLWIIIFALLYLM